MSNQPMPGEKLRQRASRRSGVSGIVHATGSKPGCWTITFLRRDEPANDSGSKLDLALDAFHVFNVTT